MSTNQGSRRVDAFPYRHAGESLDFEYLQYDLDGDQSKTIDGARYLDLSDSQRWDTTNLEVSITVEEETLERVFPSTSPFDGELVVVGYCPTNHYRFDSVIASAPIKSETYQGTVSLNHEKLRGRVELAPLLLRTSKLEKQPDGHTGPPYAERPGQKLAHGPIGRVDIDEPIGGRSKDLPTIPTSFSSAPFPADDGNMWYLDMRDKAQPKLHINSDHGFVVPLFQDKGQDGRGRVRQLVVDMLGTQIMTQFVLEAAELYAVDGNMRYSWQERMLTEVADDLFGDKSPDEVEEMLEPGTLSETVNEISTRMQRRRAPHEQLERVLDLNL